MIDYIDARDLLFKLDDLEEILEDITDGYYRIKFSRKNVDDDFKRNYQAFEQYYTEVIKFRRKFETFLNGINDSYLKNHLSSVRSPFDYKLESEILREQFLIERSFGYSLRIFSTGDSKEYNDLKRNIRKHSSCRYVFDGYYIKSCYVLCDTDLYVLYVYISPLHLELNNI